MNTKPQSSNVRRLHNRTPEATPPHSIEAEQSTLGGLMLDNSCYPEVAAIVTEADFYRADHRLIFRAMRELIGENSPIDVITLSEALEKRGQLEDAGGLSYLGVIARDTPCAANVETYAKNVRERSIDRQRIDAFHNKDWRRLEELNRQADKLWLEKHVHLGDSVLTYSQMLEANISERPEILPWMREGTLLMAYSRPGLGKTMFGLSLAASITQGTSFAKWPVYQQAEALYVDGEMSFSEMRQRTQGFIQGPGDGFHILSHEWLFTLDDQADLCLNSLTRQEELKQFIESRPEIKFVVLDNESCLFPGADGDKRAMWPVIVQPFLMWLRRKGIACLLLHHAGKSGTQYGTSERERPFDVIIKLDQPAGWTPEEGAHFVVKFEKTRGVRGDAVGALEMRLEGDEHGRPVWTYQREMSPERQEIIDLLEDEGPMKPAAIARELGKPSGNIRFLLSKMIQIGALAKRLDGKYELTTTNTTNATNTANTTNTTNDCIKNQQTLAGVSEGVLTLETAQPCGLEQNVSGVSGVSRRIATSEHQGGVSSDDGFPGDELPQPITRDYLERTLPPEVAGVPLSLILDEAHQGDYADLLNQKVLEGLAAPLRRRLLEARHDPS